MADEQRDAGRDPQPRGGGGGPVIHGVDPSDPARHVTPGAITDQGGTPDKTVTPGAITDQAGLDGAPSAPNAIRNPIVPPDARPGD